MPFISDAQAAAVAQSTVRIATLAEFQFVSETMRLWNGAGRITVESVEWQGLNLGGAVDGFPDLIGTKSASVTAKLSAVDPAVIALAKNSVEDVQGQLAYFWFQLFGADWQPLGPRIPAWWGIMQRIRIERTPGDDATGGALVAALEIENIYAARGRSGAGRYTDSDQRYRYPGDTFFEFVSDQKQRTLVWPNY